MAKLISGEGAFVSSVRICSGSHVLATACSLCWEARSRTQGGEADEEEEDDPCLRDEKRPFEGGFNREFMPLSGIT